LRANLVLQRWYLLFGPRRVRIQTFNQELSYRQFFAEV
jgi:hypothetical protein